MQQLFGHTSEENAFLVNDYPYGRMRCRIRYWIEYRSGMGFRFCSQTENPKTLRWNAPKKGTYCSIAMSMYLDNAGHVMYSALTEYSSADDVFKFITNFPDADLVNVRVWAMQKVAFNRKYISGEVFFTINGVKQPPTETDIERYKAELATWEKCVAHFQPSPVQE
jgi:hypothetical protein